MNYPGRLEGKPPYRIAYTFFGMCIFIFRDTLTGEVSRVIITPQGGMYMSIAGDLIRDFAPAMKQGKEGKDKQQKS